MESRQWKIKKYVTADGVCPFDEWFEQLDFTLQGISTRKRRNINNAHKRLSRRFTS
jgi:hypothetical protein